MENFLLATSIWGIFYGLIQGHLSLFISSRAGYISVSAPICAVYTPKNEIYSFSVHPEFICTLTWTCTHVISINFEWEMLCAMVFALCHFPSIFVAFFCYSLWISTEIPPLFLCHVYIWLNMNYMRVVIFKTYWKLADDDCVEISYEERITHSGKKLENRRKKLELKFRNYQNRSSYWNVFFSLCLNTLIVSFTKCWM